MSVFNVNLHCHRPIASLQGILLLSRNECFSYACALIAACKHIILSRVAFSTHDIPLKQASQNDSPSINGAIYGQNYILIILNEFAPHTTTADCELILHFPTE